MNHLVQLRSPKEVEAALTADSFLLFKHSTQCPVSATAFAHYRIVLETNAIASAWLEVVEQRPLSQMVAELTGVQHESPQALLVRQGTVIWNASHGSITLESLEIALGQVGSGSKR